jgi:uncharacterized membrane protein YcaP (DUF421 family)
VFDLGTPLWNIAVRSLLVYLAVFVGLRLMGKRELGQMTVFDLVVVLLIANAVQNAMVGADFSVQGGILAAFILLAVNRIIAMLRLHRGAWGRLIEGKPTLLVKDGKVLRSALRKEELDRADVEMAAREHGIRSIEEVQMAVLETDGSISIVPMSTPVLKSRRHVRQFKKH